MINRTASLTGIAALLLAIGAAHAETDLYSAFRMLRLSLQTPPDFKEHLGPAVYSSKPWHAERMPIKVKHPPINDARIMPPSEFDHDYTGRMVVQRVDEAGIRDACKGMTQTGCTYHTAGSESCFVWIVYDDILNYQQYSYDVVYRHERAHCNGWHHDKYGKTVDVPKIAKELIELGQRRLKELE